MNINSIFLETPHFSFKYDGSALNGFEPGTARSIKKLPALSEANYEITYDFKNGIKVYENLCIYENFNTAKVLLNFENISGANSGAGIGAGSGIVNKSGAGFGN